MTSESARRILERIEAEWRPLREAADRLGPVRLEQRTPAGWTAKEMLAHIAFWDEAGVTSMLMFRNPQLPEGWRFGSGYVPEDPWPRADAHNAREAAWARPLPATQVRARLDVAHEQCLVLLSTVTDLEAVAHADYFNRRPDHYQEHLPELQALLRSKDLADAAPTGSGE
jgi:hypothetical protein